MIILALSGCMEPMTIEEYLECQERQIQTNEKNVKICEEAGLRTRTSRSRKCDIVCIYCSNYE